MFRFFLSDNKYLSNIETIQVRKLAERRGTPWAYLIKMFDTYQSCLFRWCEIPFCVQFVNYCITSRSMQSAESFKYCHEGKSAIIHSRDLDFLHARPRTEKEKTKKKNQKKNCKFTCSTDTSFTKTELIFIFTRNKYIRYFLLILTSTLLFQILEHLFSNTVCMHSE